MKNKETLLSMMSGVLLQIATLISGFIIPKIILSYFGSEVNGLVYSVNQFLSYITLVDGGLSGVIIANLYKPLVEKDSDKVSSIINTANRFFRKIGFIFIAYTLLLACVYPLIFKTQLSFGYIFLLTVIMSVNLLIQYMFSLSFKALLRADKKGYIENFTQTIIVVANIIVAIISVQIFPSIHILKLISGILFVIQPIVFSKYIKKHYDIKRKASINNELLSQRWDGFAINLAAFIHNSTDITVLTIFSDLPTVSVYGVYAMVSNGIKGIINAALTGIAHTVGQAYARKDFEEVNKKLDIYEYIVFVLVFFFMTVAALLITPFVLIYTKNITDANYNQPIFGILLCVSEALYLVKLPHLNLAYSANKFKEIAKPAFAEAIINIVVSIALVRWIGLCGVAIGTICGMLYRLLFHIYYTAKLVPGRVQWIFYRKFLLFGLISCLGYFICRCIPLRNVTILSWISLGFFYSFIIGSLILLLSFICFRDEMHFFINYLKKR